MSEAAAATPAIRGSEAHRAERTGSIAPSAAKTRRLPPTCTNAVSTGPCSIADRSLNGVRLRPSPPFPGVRIIHIQGAVPIAMITSAAAVRVEKGCPYRVR